VERLLSRNLVTYLTSRFCAGTAVMLLRAGVLWHVFALTGSPFHLGLVGVLQFLPSLALTLVGGAVADTYERRTIMLAAQTVSLTGGTVLAIASALGHSTLPLLYATVVTVSAANAFDSPSRMALLPTLVSRDRFPRAVTLAATTQALAFATGPAAAGIIIASAGAEAVYSVFVCLVAASLVALAMLRPASQARTTTNVNVRAIVDGLRFVRRSQVVLGCMALDMFAVIFGGANALLPVYANEILHVGPRGYGLLSSSFELGALLASFVLTALPPIRRTGRALLAAVGVYGVATVGFGLSRTFPLSIAAYLLVGMADQVSVVMRGTAIQLSTPDELRGRVSAVNMLFINASNQLGAAESGFLAAATSATFAVVSGGVAALGVLGLVAWRLPELRRYQLRATASRSAGRAPAGASSQS
jgi:MFS family permease